MRVFSIRAQLLILAAACFALMAGLSALVVTGSRSDSAALRDVYERGFLPMLALQDVDRQLKETRFRLAGVLLEQIPIPGSRNHLKEVRESAPAAWKKYLAASNASASAHVELVAQINKGWSKFNDFASALELAYAENDRKKLAVLLEDEWPAVHIALVKPLELLLPQAIKEAESVYEERASATARRQVLAMVGLVAGGILITAFLIGFYLRLKNGFGQVVTSMRRLAGGDLAVDLDCRASSETVVISQEFRSAVVQLNGLVTRIHGIASHMQTASSEIALGHEDLSTRTTQQAASLEETAASMEEMTATVTQNAESARKASQLSRGATEVAARGGTAVNVVVKTMDGISESSRKIGDIIGVIDSIAFQTNILALNAAVEAARAGEQGRGFAVVASEVRNLAGKSAEASKQIRQLIADSLGQVEAGSRQVAAAGATMVEIVESVTRVSTLIGEISMASQEQAQSIAQVSSVVQQLETVTQQNASMVGEASAASMEQQAAALMHAVGGFTLADNLDPDTPARATSYPVYAGSAATDVFDPQQRNQHNQHYQHHRDWAAAPNRARPVLNSRIGTE